MEKLEQIENLTGIKQSEMDAELKSIFDKAGIEVETPQGNVEVVGDTIHLMSDNHSTIQGRLLSEIETKWNNHNRELILNVKKEELPKIRISCMRCLKQEFNDLEEAPRFEEFQTMKFIRKEIDQKVFTNKSGRKEKAILGNSFLFECEVCGAKNCISIEEEQ